MGYVISNFLLKGMAIITTPIFTRLLTTEEYGYVGGFCSWLSILAALLGLGLTYSVGVAKIDFQDKFDAFLSSIYSLSFVFDLAVLIVVIINIQAVSNFMSLNKCLVVFIFVYLIVEPAISIYSLKLRYSFKYSNSIAISLINAIGGSILAIILVVLLPSNKYMGRIFGTYGVPLMMGLYCAIKIYANGRVIYNKQYWKYALKIAIPMIPHGISILILAQIDRIVILKYCTASDLGLYSFVYSYSVILSLFSNAIGMAWLPWFNEAIHFGKNKDIKKYVNLISGFMCILSIIFILVAPEVMLLLGTKEYLQAKNLAISLTLATLIQYFYTNYVNYELYSKKTIFISIGSILAAIANYVLNILFIPIYGYEAAAYTTLIGYLLLLIMHFVIVRYKLDSKLYDDKKLFYMLLLTILLCGVIYLVYDLYLVRYSILIILLLVVCIVGCKIYNGMNR